MYLKELGTYKPTQVKASDADAHVHKFAIPSPPTSPEDSNLANGLKDYEAQSPEIEGASTDPTAQAVVEDWFEEEEETAPAAH